MTVRAHLQGGPLDGHFMDTREGVSVIRLPGRDGSYRRPEGGVGEWTFVPFGEPNVEAVSPEEEAGVRAMVDLKAEGEIGEVPGPEPVIYGGTDPDGVSQISIRVPKGSPVSVRRLWVSIAEVVAQECLRVGIPVEGGSAEAFRSILEDRADPALPS